LVNYWFVSSSDLVHSDFIPACRIGVGHE
jgi:hypothetical protein